MDKQIENRRSHNISRCDVWVYGNGRSRAVAWVLVVSQVFVRALCLRLCVWQCCWLGQIFFWVEVILFCTCTRVQVRNTAALCGLHSCWLIPGKSVLSGHRWATGAVTVLASLCTHVVTCMCIISGYICWVCMFSNTHFMCQKLYTAKRFFFFLAVKLSK